LYWKAILLNLSSTFFTSW